MTRLTVVIVSYNCRPDLERCLAALTSAAPRTAHEVVVVDNASSDGTVAWLRERWPLVRVIEAGGNLGFGRAKQPGDPADDQRAGAAAQPGHGARARQIERLVAALDARPGTAAVGPRLVDGGGRAELSFGSMIGPMAEARQKLLVRGHARGWPVIAGAGRGDDAPVTNG
jgi:GT2 family glycosyltransferase